jgi:hypothetical protein
VNGITKAAGKLWGTIKAILALLPKAARADAATIRGWIRTGKLTAAKVRGAWVVALEDVLMVERETRKTAQRRGGRPRGKTGAAVA